MKISEIKWADMNTDLRIGVSAQPWWVGKGITWMGKDNRKDDAWSTHTFNPIAKVNGERLMFDSQPWTAAVRSEDEWLRKVRENKGGIYVIFKRVEPLAPGEVVALRAVCEEIDGGLYAFGQYPGQALDRLLGKAGALAGVCNRPPVFFRRAMLIFPRRVVCSGASARILMALHHWKTTMRNRAADPDDVWDWLMDQVATGRWMIDEQWNAEEVIEHHWKRKKVVTECQR